MFRRLLFLVFLFSVGLSAQNTTQSLGFKENKGQIVDQKGNPNPDVLYLLNTGGLNVQLRKNGFSYDVYETKKNPLTEKDKRRKENIMNYEDKPNSLPDYSLEYIYHRVDIDFEGSNPSAELVAEGKSKDYDNYYTLQHAPEGILMVHQYEKITYKNLYPNIDVVFFVPEDAAKAVEYNFIIRPGGKASDIRMKFNGVKTDLADGKIKMKTRFGTMEETLPLSWTEDGKARKEIAVGYKKLNKNVYGFAVTGEISSSKTIVIDPVPIRLWGTYYANELVSSSGALQTDSQNNVYICGATQSQNNVATVGTHLSTFDAQQNCYYAKIDTNGVRVWGTYYSIYSMSIMVIDHDFSVLFGGSIINDEINITTPDSHQPTKSVYNDMFLVKLNSSGIREWGTYYGDVQNDYLNSIAVDSFNNVYIGGQSESTENLTTPDSFQPESTNTYQGILVKFSPEGERIWGTYYNGGIVSVNISTDDFIYISGRVGNVSNVSTSGSYQENNAGEEDVFIVKFNTSCQRIWGTFLGGPGSDYAYHCRLVGNYLYFHGQTSSHSGLATTGTFIDNHADLIANYPEPSNGPLSLYIMKFDVLNQQKEWCTYFFENITSLDANEDGEVFISGQTGIDENISTPGAYMTERGTYLKGYFQKFNALGQREWGSYFGGDFAEHFIRIRLDGLSDIYLNGTTFNSTTGIATTPGMISSSNTTVSAFLVKFRDCLSSVTLSSNSPVCLNETLELTATGGTNYSWTGPNGFTSTLQNPTITNATPLVAGEYFCTVTGTGGCDDTISIIVTVGDTIAPVPDVATLPTIIGTCNLLIIPTPTATDACMGSIIATTTSPLVYTLEGTYTIIWEYNDGTTVATQNQTIVIEPQSLPVANANVFFCIQENKTLADITITGQDIKWYDEATAGTLLPNTTLLENGYTYYASQTIDGCESARIPVTATIQDTPGPTGFAVQYFCDTQSLTLADFVLTGTDVVFYDSQFGGSILPITTPLVDDMGYWASQTVNDCESSLRTPFISDIISDLPANNYTVNVCDNLNDGSEEVDLSDYEEEIIPASSNYSFSYYTDYTSADIGNTANEITDFNAYDLQLGMNSIYVRVENATLCYKVVLLELNLIATPILNMLDTYGLCEGRSTTLTADPGFYTYTWSTGALSQSIVVTEPGNYGVTVTEYHGDVICGTTKNITVVASNVATITSIETSDWTSDENMLTVLVTGLGDYEYSLDGIHYQSSNQFIGLEDGEYTVYVRDINGCGIAKEDVYLLMYPKFFTPNADGHNDFWGIKFYQNEPSMVVKIFDRYGKFIKQLTDTDPTWDGTYNGTAQTATDYWFTVIRANGEEHKGHFSLKR